jgi:hypothetical protein
LYIGTSFVRVGDQFTVTLQAAGYVNGAWIAGQPVAYPTGSLLVNAAQPGTYSLQGQVNGPGGTSYCSATYTVQ